MWQVPSLWSIRRQSKPLLFVLFTVFFECGESLRCVQCNSLFDPTCADPYVNNTLDMVDCDTRHKPHLGDVVLNPKVCRKIIQKVHGETRFIRSCGWLIDNRESNNECFRRAGSLSVFVTYCNCQGTGCNSAPTTTHTTTSYFYSILLAATSSIFAALSRHKNLF